MLILEVKIQPEAHAGIDSMSFFRSRETHILLKMDGNVAHVLDDCNIIRAVSISTVEVVGFVEERPKIISLEKYQEENPEFSKKDKPRTETEENKNRKIRTSTEGPLVEMGKANQLGTDTMGHRVDTSHPAIPVSEPVDEDHDSMKDESNQKEEPTKNPDENNKDSGDEENVE